MTVRTVLQTAFLKVDDFRCSADAHDAPFVELHADHSISYVRKGSFGYRVGGRSFELVAGSFVVGHPGHEYVCHHDRAIGDECLSFHLTPEFVDALGGPSAAWQSGAVAPRPELMVLGELAQAALDGTSDVGLDEVGHWLAARFVDVVSGKERRPVDAAARDR